MTTRTNARKKDKPNNTNLAKNNSSAILLIDSWLNDEDNDEQKKTFEYLKEVLDKDRLSDRQLFQ